VTLLPALTDAGEPELLVIKSAWDAVATTSVAVALLLLALGSVVEELMLAVSVITVPGGFPDVFTVTTTGKLAVPGAKLGFVQVIVPALPTAGSTHAHPTGIGLRDTKLVFGGVTSVKLALVAVLGPALVTT
jgi:hypothetical protein